MFEKYSDANPVNQVRMTARFALSTPAHVIASFFASGIIRPAPGTWGTLAGWLVYVLLAPWVSPTVWLVVAAMTFVLGAWASEVTSRDLGVEDHGSIVIDEVFAIWLVLALVPATLVWQIAAFVAFRVFDIVKLPPASYIDRHMKNGVGIMLDDLFAALWAIALLWGANYALTLI